MKLNQGLITRKTENYWGQRKSSLEMKGKRGSVFVFESTSVLGIGPAIIIISALHYYFFNLTVCFACYMVLVVQKFIKSFL